MSHLARNASRRLATVRRRYIGGTVPKRAAKSSLTPRGQGRRTAGAAERANRLYDSLRNLIVRGQLAPGARIVETEVAERFGVSRTPVRAAFQRLEREGYVIASATHQARMTVAPHAVNFHVEHHLLMTVPWFRLAALHRLLAARDALPAGSLSPGYGAVLRAVTAPRA